MNFKVTKYPQVLKNQHGSLVIIYQDRVEIYELKRKDTKAEIEADNPECCYNYEEVYGKGWNAAHEVEIHKNNGYRHVNTQEEKEVRL